MVEGITPDETLDCRGLSCPMPLLKTKKTMKKLKPGQILEILGTDPGSKNDLPDYADKQGDEFLGMEEKSGYTRFLIKKRG
jgi:tRNA 2-thiouridine synthesizing protein A